MKPIHLQLTITVDGDSAEHLFELLARAIEQGTVQCRPKTSKERPVSSREAPEQKTGKMPSAATQHGTAGREDKADHQELLIGVQEATKMLGISPRKLWQMYNSGEMPKPIRIGRSVRWSREELESWVNAGCPKVGRL